MSYEENLLVGIKPAEGDTEPSHSDRELGIDSLAMHRVPIEESNEATPKEEAQKPVTSIVLQLEVC